MGRILLWGFHSFMLALILYVPVGAHWTFTLISKLFNLPFIWLNLFSKPISTLFFLSNVFFLVAAILFIIEFLIIHNIFKPNRRVKFKKFKNPKIVVGMTAYNDEDAIGLSVKEFLKHPFVKEVVVVDNNSVDNTSVVARKAGASVFVEKQQGYGYCCRRALFETYKSKPDIMCLVEGDMTFSSEDLNKLIAYIGHVDLVLGTRTTEELQESDSQMNRFINLGNQFISKLIQIRFWGKTRLTDVGCTYRILRPEAYEKLRLKLKIGNSTFSPHMIIEALKLNLKVIEVPITLKKRIGDSKGVGDRHIRGFLVGLRMWWQILKS